VTVSTTLVTVALVGQEAAIRAAAVVRYPI